MSRGSIHGNEGGVLYDRRGRLQDVKSEGRDSLRTEVKGVGSGG